MKKKAIDIKLINAISENNFEAVEECLSKGANPNTVANDDSPDLFPCHVLNIAIKHADFKMIDLLIEKGSNPFFKEVKQDKRNKFVLLKKYPLSFHRRNRDVSTPCFGWSCI